MIELRGIAVSHGIAIGRALVIGPWEMDVPHYNVRREDTRSELRRFFRARRRAREEIVALRESTREKLGDKYAAIFDAHLKILDDRRLGRETMERVRGDHMNVEWALAAAVQGFLATIETVDDPYIRERGGDLSDVHRRLQRVLAGQENRHTRRLALDEDTIVVAHTLSPSDSVWLHQQHVRGFVTEEGGQTSHTAILAAALEIPAVLGVERVTRQARTGQTVGIDGGRGRVLLDPAERELLILRGERDRLASQDRSLEGQKGPTVTRDGIALRIAANIEFPEEMETVSRVGAEGIGLYRTEFLFLATSPDLPGEEEHVAAYRRIASATGGETAVIRTLDIGGEKYFHEVLEGGEANPVLGMRAVRFCLARPDIFRVQLRGVMRVAAEYPNVWVLVPMISGVAEWRTVRTFVEGVRDELRGEGVDVPAVPLGCMIEVPSAALVAERLAAEADFFSIGTNDLVQYLVAVDRGNRAVGHLASPWHPAVLELLRRVIEAAATARIPVSLCGEMASDPLGALTLLGLGLTSFSCNPVQLPEIRSVLRAASAREARAAVERAMRLATAEEIRESLADELGPVIESALGGEHPSWRAGDRPAGPAGARGPARPES